MMKVALHSVPRSGSSWVGEIFNSSPAVVYRYQPLFSFAFKDQLRPTSSAADIDAFFKDIGVSDDPFIGQHEKRVEGTLPRFRKEAPACVVYKEVRYHYLVEHLLSTANDVRVIGLIRSPLSVISSWLRAPREFRGDLGWDAMEEWRCAPKKNAGRCEEYNGFEKWVEVAHLFHRLRRNYPERFRLLHYGDLLIDTCEVVKDLFAWVGLPFGEQTQQFLAESTSRNVDHAYSVYRTHAVDDKWKEQLDPRIVRAIVRELRGSDLEYLLGLTESEIQSILNVEADQGDDVRPDTANHA